MNFGVGLRLAGGMAWKVDAMTWRSGAWNLPAAAKNYSPVETTACYGWGHIVLPDVIACAVLTGAGAHAAKRFILRGPALPFFLRPPLEGASCFARRGPGVPFFLAMAPGISIPCRLRLTCESPRLARRE